MGKREWKCVEEGGQGEEWNAEAEQALALWAIVERLEALVAIGDALEEVSDLWANTLAFGGQPVGEVEQPVSTRGVWLCHSDRDCILMRGHDGEHVHKPPAYCQCVKPVFTVDAMVHERRDCTKCGMKER